MDTFRCQSCGSTNIVEKNNQHVCAYCHSNLIKKEPVKSSKHALYYISFVLLIAILAIAYNFFQKNTIEELKNSTISKKEIMKKITAYKSDALSNIKNIYPSKVTDKNEKLREKTFTPWLSKKDYQSRFNNGYYKNNNIYPAYVELDNQGNRRVIEIEYEPKFYWYVASGRLFKDFQKRHISNIMNGKKLLSMSIITKEGINLYTGTWISKDAFEREAKKLMKFGIYPPKLKFQNISEFLPTKNINATKIKVKLITADSKEADTKGRIFLSINSSDEHRYLLDKPKYKDHSLGSEDEYIFNIDFPMQNIKNIKLSIEGYDAWKMEHLSIQFIQKDKYSSKYILNANQWFSQEKHDIDKFGAIPSYTFETNTKTYTKDKAPTLYLSAPKKN